MNLKNGKNRNQTLKYKLLIVIMIVLLVMFGKSFGVLFIMANLFAVMMIMYINKVNKKTDNRKLKAAGWICSITYCLFILSFIMIEGFVIYEMQESKRTEPQNIDYLIILGAGLHGEKPSKSLETRLKAGTEFLKNNKEIPAIVSGGQGPGETISEAEAMARYLKKNGITENRILYENKSTSTYENLKYSKDVIEQLGGKNPTVLIVTNDYHIARTKMIANEFDLKGYYLNAESPTFVKINYLIREYFAFVETWFFQLV